MYVALVIKGKLLHLAASAICVKTWPLRLRYASILPVPECDMRQGWEILNYDIYQKGVKQIEEVGQRQISGEEGLSIVAPFLRHTTTWKRGNSCTSWPVQCMSKHIYPRLRYATADFNTNMRDRTKVHAGRRKTLLPIVPTSTLCLTHIALAATSWPTTCNKLPFSKLQYTSKSGILNCDIQQKTIM